MRIAAWLFVLVASPACVATTGADAIDPSRWEGEIAAFEALEAASPAPRDAVVFYGSSSIRLWTSLTTDFPHVVVVNRGFGGSTIPDAIHFAPRVVLPLAPRAIVLYAGDNDLQEGRTPAQVAADFARFVRTVRGTAPDVAIVYLAIKPSPARAALVPAARDANARIRAIAASLRDVTFVDVATPMLDAAGAPRGELFGPDALHLDADGYALWRRLLASTLVRFADARR